MHTSLAWGGGGGGGGGRGGSQPHVHGQPLRMIDKFPHGFSGNGMATF